MDILAMAIATQANKRSQRLRTLADKMPQQTLIAAPNGFDTVTGTYTAMQPDGGTIPYRAGNFPPQPDQISIVLGANSSIGFGDWR